MSRFKKEDRVLAGIGIVTVIASLVIGGTTGSQSRGTSWDVETDATSQATSDSGHRGTSWD
jgi:alpha-D-ribose 1-methylphosphonate 5-triphosphate diphosphatase PhnM